MRSEVFLRNANDEFRRGIAQKTAIPGPILNLPHCCSTDNIRRLSVLKNEMANARSQIHVVIISNDDLFSSGISECGWVYAENSRDHEPVLNVLNMLIANGVSSQIKYHQLLAMLIDSQIRHVA